MRLSADGAGARLPFPELLTFPATRRLVARLAGEPDSRRRTWASAAAWWMATLIVLPVYAFLRSSADNVGLPVHGAELERALFGTLPTLRLQHWLWDGSQTLEWAVVIVHSSWFFVPALLGLLVTVLRPHRVGSYLRWWIAAELLAVAFFALFPLRPPWLADREVVRIIALRFGGQIQDSNPLAAMPSLHVAFPFVLALWFSRERWLFPAWAMFGYTGLIALEVVFSGEHYVLDVAGAVAFGLLVAGLARLDLAQTARRSLAWLTSRRRRFGLRAAVRSAVRSERGQALIELAFVLPVMLVFLLALVDFGLALDRREVIQHAAREGARKGAVGYSVSAIINETVNQSQGVLTAADVSVCYVDGPDVNATVGDAGDNVRVNVNYTYSFTAGSGELLSTLGIGPPAITMTPVAEARLEATVTGATSC